MLRAAAAAVREDEPWPVPRVHLDGEEPFFLFIITPPYSGSTALAKVLNTAARSMLLHEDGEGQWLVPGMRQKDRWDSEKAMRWDSVRAVWLSRVRMIEAHVGRVDVVIEKSPPNLVRMDQMSKVFPNNRMLAFNRNPYANAASILFRHHRPEQKTEAERCDILRRIALEWTVRSTWVRKWIRELDALPLTYEEFCLDPDGQVKRITRAVPALTDVDPSRDIKVKDYPVQRIQGQNERQVAKLTASEQRAIAEVLESHADLLSFFAYTVEWQTAAEPA